MANFYLLGSTYTSLPHSHPSSAMDISCAIISPCRRSFHFTIAPWIEQTLVSHPRSLIQERFTRVLWPNIIFNTIIATEITTSTNFQAINHSTKHWKWIELSVPWGVVVGGRKECLWQRVLVTKGHCAIDDGHHWLGLDRLLSGDNKIWPSLNQSIRMGFYMAIPDVQSPFSVLKPFIGELRFVWTTNTVSRMWLHIIIVFTDI